MRRLLSILILTVLGGACGHAQTAESRLTARDFLKKIEQTPGAQVVDVRTPAEFKAGHIGEASNIDIRSSDFKRMASVLDKSKPVFVYCLSGGRSASAVKYFQEQGYTQVYEMPGGMMEWRNNDLPEVKLTVTSEGMSLTEYEAQLQSGKVILVDFYAEWCAPCKKMAPFLDKISTELSGEVTVIRIDADQNARLCKALEISALPVLKIYRDGKESWTHTGFVDEETLRAKIRE